MLNWTAVTALLLGVYSPYVRNRSNRAQQWKRHYNGGPVSRCMQSGTLLLLMALISCNVYHTVLAATPAAVRGAAREAPARAEGPRSASSHAPRDEAAAVAAPGVQKPTEVGKRVEEVHYAVGRGEREAVGHHSVRTARGQLAEMGSHEERQPAAGAPGRGVRTEDRTAVSEEEEARRGPGGGLTSGKASNKLPRAGESSALKSRLEDSPVKAPEPGYTAGVRIEEEKQREVEGQERGREAGKKEEKMKRQEWRNVHAGNEVREKPQEQKRELDVEAKKGGEEGMRATVMEKKDQEKEGKEKVKKDAELKTAERKEGGGSQIVDRVEDKDKGDAVLGLEGIYSLLDKERAVLEKMMESVFRRPSNFRHPFCLFPGSVWCADDTRPIEERRLSRIPDLIQQTRTLMSSIFSFPFFAMPFPFTHLWSGEGPVSVHPAGAGRLRFTINRELPTEDIRLYVVPSERRVGLAADRVMKRAEEGKDYSRMFGRETRLHAVASIAEGCMASEELVKAGLIGWSFDGKTGDRISILVTFPSEAHAKELIMRKHLSEEALKRLIEGKGLEQLTPSEKCLLSGRTESECEQLKARAGEKREKALSFSTKGYADNEIRIPEFVYV